MTDNDPVSENLVSKTFRAMNSDIELFATGAPAERRLERAERWLAAYEARFSRFRVLSELSRLNTSAGRPFIASPGLFTLAQLGLTLARRSAGLFDPTVLPALDAAGYDRSFELVRGRGDKKTAPRRRFTWQDVELDPATRSIRMPEGCGIDLGGIGKGWAVDRMAAILGEPCLVNGGGDVYAGERPEDGTPWRIGVADPFEPERDVMVLAVENRGVATSSTLKRRWQSGDIWQHHLIDPRTGGPSESDAVQVTAVAPTAVEADYHAKVALLLGTEGGLEYLDRETGVEGLVFRKDGRTFESDGFAALAGGRPGVDLLRAGA